MLKGENSSSDSLRSFHNNEGNVGLLKDSTGWETSHSSTDYAHWNNNTHHHTFIVRWEWVDKLKVITLNHSFLFSSSEKNIRGGLGDQSLEIESKNRLYSKNTW